MMQYANNIMDTHVYDPRAQRRFLEEGLSDNTLYKTVEQQEALFSVPGMLEMTGDYGFTAGTTIASFGATGAAKGVISGALKLQKGLRGIRGIKDAASWTKTLRNAVKAKDFLSTSNGMIVATAEGAGITLQNKQAHYHDGYVTLQNKYFEEWVKQNPTLAASVLQSYGMEDVPQGLMRVSDGAGKMTYTDVEKQQMIEQFKELSQYDPEHIEAFKKQKAKEFEEANPELAAVDYKELEDRVEDAATAEFIIQSAVNGILNHGMKSTLNAKSLQKARKNVARRMGINVKDPGTDLSKKVKIKWSDAEGKWTAESVKRKAWDLSKERLKESAGEAIEEGLQDVGGAFGTGYYDYAYQDYINSRFGENDGLNDAIDYSIWEALGSGLSSAAKSTISGQTL